MAALERELSQLIGRRVDLRTPREISRYFRDQVIHQAETQYAEG
jgi:predicted nucleotidyltransferase